MTLRKTFPKIKEGEDIVELTEEIADDLSSDQYVLWLCWVSVKTGKLRLELCRLTPGPISHSR